MSRRLPILLFFLVLPVVLAGCDAVGGGEDTITLSTEREGSLKAIEYTFSYSRDDVTNGTITVSSAPDSDQESLDEMLERIAAASRSDIQAAKVTKATFRRVSSGSSTETPKVFSYLSRAEVRLGSRSGPLVALSDPTPVPSTNSPVEMTLGSGASDVANVLKEDSPTSAVLDLEVENRDDVSSFEEIEVKIFYSLTVR